MRALIENLSIKYLDFTFPAIITIIFICLLNDAMWALNFKQIGKPKAWRNFIPFYGNYLRYKYFSSPILFFLTWGIIVFNYILSGPSVIGEFIAPGEYFNIFNNIDIISISKILVLLIRIKFMYDIFKRWNVPLIRWPLYAIFFLNWMSEFIISFALGDVKACNYSKQNKYEK